MQSAIAPKLSMKQVLLCGAMIVTLSMGIRHGFGLWLQPITLDRGWRHGSCAFLLAIPHRTGRRAPRWGHRGGFWGHLGDPLRRVWGAGRRQPALRRRPGADGAGH